MRVGKGKGKGKVKSKGKGQPSTAYLHHGQGVRVVEAARHVQVSVVLQREAPAAVALVVVVDVGQEVQLVHHDGDGADDAPVHRGESPRRPAWPNLR